MRLFIAIPFCETVKNSIDEVCDNVFENSLSGRFSARENFHITLLFLGEQPNCKRAIAAMEKVNRDSFDLTLSGLGKFQREGGSVIWMGINKSNQLEFLHDQLSKNLPEIKSESKFRPHITLGRQVILKGDIKQIPAPDINVHVDRFVLMESSRINGKLTYTTRFEKRLLK